MGWDPEQEGEGSQKDEELNQPANLEPQEAPRETGPGHLGTSGITES